MYQQVKQTLQDEYDISVNELLKFKEARKIVINIFLQPWSNSDNILDSVECQDP